MTYIIPRLLCSLGFHQDQTRTYKGVTFHGTAYCTRRVGALKNGGRVLCGKALRV